MYIVFSGLSVIGVLVLSTGLRKPALPVLPSANTRFRGSLATWPRASQSGTSALGVPGSPGIQAKRPEVAAAVASASGLGTDVPPSGVASTVDHTAQYAESAAWTTKPMTQRVRSRQRQGLANQVCDPIKRAGQIGCSRNIGLMVAACVFTGLGPVAFVHGEFFKLVGAAPCAQPEHEFLRVPYRFDSLKTLLHAACSCFHATNRTECVGNSDDGSSPGGEFSGRTGLLECEWDGNQCLKDPSVLSLAFIAFGLGDAVGGAVNLARCCFNPFFVLHHQ
eukprot:SAG31_NODE_1787_length_7268_cov_6.628679_2_plen_278_part_00